MACLLARHHAKPHLHNTATDPRGQVGQPLRGLVEVALLSTSICYVLHLKPASATAQQACVVCSARRDRLPYFRRMDVRPFNHVSSSH